MVKEFNELTLFLLRDHLNIVVVITIITMISVANYSSCRPATSSNLLLIITLKVLYRLLRNGCRWLSRIDFETVVSVLLIIAAISIVHNNASDWHIFVTTVDVCTVKSSMTLQFSATVLRN